MLRGVYNDAEARLLFEVMPCVAMLCCKEELGDCEKGLCKVPVRCGAWMC